MAISNSVGSNTYDILVCLGLPWFIRSLMTSAPVEVEAAGLKYTIIILLACLVFLYGLFIATKFILNKTVGFICLALYLAFITVAMLFELNVFFHVNDQPCPSDF